ncbi:MAG TPA: hypothetical protein VL625_01035 [Patescibacteria group bacterium]|nr:hypothetical protein [Patescibacteria group bacterium]
MRIAPPPGATVCTMDAKKCPDGSWVSRTGPNCEFAPCPGEKSDEGTDGGEDDGAGNSSGSGESGEGETAPPIYLTPDTPQSPVLVPRSSIEPPHAMDDESVVLDQWLKTIPGAESGQMQKISDPAVASAFPDIHFYALRFRMYPVARAAPEPLKASNVVALSSVGNGTVTNITEESQLERFFKSSLAPMPEENDKRKVLRAWLTLVGELQQDSFFHFSDPGDSITVSPTDNGSEVSGKIIAIQGGTGGIEAKMRFNEAGSFETVETKVQLNRGIRPICQATKLLDKDPVVRRMAEQDLLVMGRDGEAYLQERRAKASPALRLAIDGIWTRIVREGR